jgi:hypothetical protein
MSYPETTSFKPYPTYLRLMARRRGEKMPAPTEDEYADAFRILMDTFEDDLTNEAMRIVEEWRLAQL